MSRRRRAGEVVCRCGAYGFPHRQMGGACDGGAFVESKFEHEIHNECRDCHLREQSEEDGQVSCQVLQGREPPRRCPLLEAHIRFEGIKLYGTNR